MKDIKIVAKSNINKEQILEKMKYGVNRIELQLLKDYLNSNLDNKTIFENVITTGCDIVSIHMPLIEKGEELNLEYFTHEDYSKVFMRVCELAEMFSKKYNHEIIIVIHNGFSLDTYKKMLPLLLGIENVLEKAINKYKNIIFSIENICPFIEKEENIVARNGFIFENVEMANYFNNRFNTNIFKTTLDTCHILFTQKVLEYYNDSKSFNKEILTTENFFLQNKNTVNNIHLSNLLNKGLNKLEHGAPFKIENNDDIEFMKKFIKLYNLYEIDAYITLEVCEYDYLNCINFKNTKECLEYVLNKFY